MLLLASASLALVVMPTVLPMAAFSSTWSAAALLSAGVPTANSLTSPTVTASAWVSVNKPSLTRSVTS